MSLILPPLVALVMSLNIHAVHAADGWIGVSRTNALLKQKKRNGEIPVSVECRQDQRVKVRLKPQYKFIWKKNTKQIDWRMLGFELLPGATIWKSDRQYKMVSSKTFKLESSGKKFRCAVWHQVS